MKIKRVTDLFTLEKLYQFRHRIFVEELNWFPWVGNRLTDKFDAYSHNYVAFDQYSKIVGTLRIVPDSPGGLPLERLFSLTPYRKNKNIVEMCRFAVSSEHRSSRLFLRLMAASYQCAEMIGSTHMALDAYLEEEPIYEGLGFKRISRPYQDPEYARKSMVVAMMASLAEIKRILVNEKPAVGKILMSNYNIYHGEIESKRVILKKSTVY